jgi:hypothetical protein
LTPVDTVAALVDYAKQGQVVKIIGPACFVPNATAGMANVKSTEAKTHPGLYLKPVDIANSGSKNQSLRVLRVKIGDQADNNKYLLNCDGSDGASAFFHQTKLYLDQPYTYDRYHPH